VRTLGIGLLAIAVAVGVYVLVLHGGEDGKRPPRPQECKLGPTTPGIDVSYYQGEITWSRVRRAGIRFAFIRVSDGTEVFDVRFEDNWRGAHRAKILRGAYQFFRPEQSPIDQANLLIRTLRAHGAGELPPVIDIEETGGLPLATVVERAQQWIARVRAELKVEPIVYTNPAMWQYRGAPELASQTLWLAHYTEQCPSIPAPWTRWTFWQYTDDGRVPGIEGAVDLNVFDGTLADLKKRYR
jgi:lysozyme